MKNFLFRTLCLASILMVSVTMALGQKKGLTNQQYIDKYSTIAQRNMQIYNIPASIILAQGILESSNGGSELAIKANNHFGIKCKSDWTGETVTHDDDAKGECFRKYPTVEDSYLDHSIFISSSSRYASLFYLEPTDYKSWAEGLQKAGYATNPKYAELLIGVIERNRLHEYDTQETNNTDYVQLNDRSTATTPTTVTQSTNREGVNSKIRENSDGYPIATINRVKYVVAKRGDTYESISQEIGISVKRLLKYNDMRFAPNLVQGDKVYIQMKKTTSLTSQNHIAEKGETIESISQRFGVRLKSLYKYNPMYTKRNVVTGDYVVLR